MYFLRYYWPFTCQLWHNVHFIYLFICLCILNAALIGHILRLSLSREFQKFGSLQICAPWKILAAAGLEPVTPGVLSQSRYQWALLAPHLCTEVYKFILHIIILLRISSKQWPALLEHRFVNPSTAKLFNLNFHPLEVVSRWRDPQLQVSENYSDLTKWRSTLFKSCWLMSHFILNIFKMWYLMGQ